MAAARLRDDPELGMGGRRRLTITDALAWAYQVELPAMERYTSGEAESRASHPMWNLGRVDGGGANWDDAAIARIVDRDALKIGQAVSALRNPAWAASADLAGFEVFQAGLSLSEAAFIGPALERAETLVITHAKLGTAPDVESQQVTAVRSGNGLPIVRREVPFRESTIAGDTLTRMDDEHVPDQPMIMLRGKPTRGKWPEGSFCLVDYWPSAHAIMRDRAEYLVWRAALDWLTVNLQGLERIEVSGCCAPRRPWA